MEPAAVYSMGFAPLNPPYACEKRAGLRRPRTAQLSINAYKHATLLLRRSPCVSCYVEIPGLGG